MQAGWCSEVGVDLLVVLVSDRVDGWQEGVRKTQTTLA